MAHDPNKDFLAKVNSAFPEEGVIFFPKPGNEGLMEILKTGRAFALAVLKYLPHSRERSLAFSRLEECLLWIVWGLMRK